MKALEKYWSLIVLLGAILAGLLGGLDWAVKQTPAYQGLTSRLDSLETHARDDAWHWRLHYERPAPKGHATDDH